MTFLEQSSFVTAIICWFVAQVLKVITVLIVDRKIDFSRFIGSGGMPSSHSAFVTGLAVSVGFASGFESEVFSIAAVLALVVMYDAAGVRRAAGEQAKILNQMITEWGKQNFKNTEVRLKELLGHTPMQVFAGAVLGIAIAMLRHFGI
ncbi:MAG: divergent PAP2 family protein [Clostridia bacterium]|nr:divergent PAP2 family protein [Clostridia bacterium]